MFKLSPHFLRDSRRRFTTRDVVTDAEVHVSRRCRLRTVFEGALVGLFVGLAIALYRFALGNAEHAMRFVTSLLKDGGALYLLWFAVLAGACLLVGKLMRVEPYTQGSGIPQTVAEVAGKIDMPLARVIPIKFVEGVLCVFSGLSLGREGPSVLLGGLIGKAVSLVAHDNRQHERLLVTCGAAAGMSAAFHAPLTGVLFAVEEIHKAFTAPLVISAMTASVAADLVCSQIVGQTPVIHFVTYVEMPHELFASVVVMGVGCGIAGSLHNAGMFVVQERVFDRITKHAPYLRIAIPFALAGVVAYFWPDLLCGGDAIIERLVNIDAGSIGFLTLLLLGKYLFTNICFGSGAPGGTLLPLVVLGALFGAIYGIVASRFVGVPTTYESEFIVLGIAGLFAAVIQSPVTAVVLVFELTGNLNALLATTTVSLIAYVTATLLGTHPFYEHLSVRLLGTIESGDNDVAEKGTMVARTFQVGIGSLVESRTIQEIHWPKDMIVVSISRAGNESIANGQTRIEALDTLTILMNAEQEDFITQRVTSMCEANT